MITVVTGMPRSGTTMMMYMLGNAGMPVYADIMPGMENHGAMQLPGNTEWLDACEGRAVKLLNPAKYRLPADREYRFIWMYRNTTQQVKSWGKFMNINPNGAGKKAMLREVRRDTQKGLEVVRSLGETRIIRFEDALQGKIDELADWLNLDPDSMRHVIAKRSSRNYRGFLEKDLYGERTWREQK
jgi:hypothetical protein